MMWANKMASHGDPVTRKDVPKGPKGKIVPRRQKKRKRLGKSPARAAHHVPWQPSAAPRNEDKGSLGEGLADAQPSPFSLLGSFREKQGR